MATPDDVRRIALDLPEAYEQASHNGTPSFRTEPRMFAREPAELRELVSDSWRVRAPVRTVRTWVARGG